MERLMNLAPNWTIKGPSDIDWPAVLDTIGGWKYVPSWVLKNFDGIVLIETNDEGLGRGQYDIAKELLAKGKQVFVLRDELHIVNSLLVADPNDWQNYFGIIGGFQCMLQD